MIAAGKQRESSVTPRLHVLLFALDCFVRLFDFHVYAFVLLASLPHSKNLKGFKNETF